jgi:hypothetical protein
MASKITYACHICPAQSIKTSIHEWTLLVIQVSIFHSALIAFKLLKGIFQSKANYTMI